MVRSLAVKLAPFAVTLVGFGLGTPSTIAQIQYPFETIQKYETTLVPLRANVSKVTNTGISVNAPYGLTQLINTNYGELNPGTGVITFSPDPATFGLQDLPGEVTLFGAGSDKLFGAVSGTGLLDFQNLVGNISGTITITGGEGKFSGATGTLTFVENNILNLDPTAPISSQAFVSGSFQTPQVVPEPENTTTLVVMGVIGVGFGLRRRKIRG